MDGNSPTENPGLELALQDKKSFYDIGQNQMLIYSELYPLLVTYNNNKIILKGAVYTDDQLYFNEETENVDYEEKWSIDMKNVDSFCLIEDTETCTLAVLHSNTISLYNSVNGNLLKDIKLKGNASKIYSSPETSPTFYVIINNDLYLMSIKKINEKLLLKQNVSLICTTARGKLVSVSKGNVVSIFENNTIVTEIVAPQPITHIFPYQYKTQGNTEGVMMLFPTTDSTTLNYGYINLDKNKLVVKDFLNFFENDNREIFGASSPYLPYVILSGAQEDQGKIVTFFNNDFKYFALEGEIDNRFPKGARAYQYILIYRTSKEDIEFNPISTVIIATHDGIVSDRGIVTSPSNIPYDRNEGQLSFLELKEAIVMGDIKETKSAEDKLFSITNNTEVVLHQSDNTLTAIAEGFNMYAISNTKRTVVGYYDDEEPTVLKIQDPSALKFITTPTTNYLIIGSNGSLIFVDTETMEIVREWNCELDIPITKIEYIPECYPYIYFHMGGTVFRYNFVNKIADEVFAGCYSFALLKKKTEVVLAYILPQEVKLSNGSQFLCLFSEKTVAYGTSTGIVLIYDPYSQLGSPMLFVGDGKKFESYKMESTNLKLMISTHSNLIAFTDGTNKPLLAMVTDDFEFVWSSNSIMEASSDYIIDAVYFDLAGRSNLSLLYISEKTQTYINRFSISNDYNMIQFIEEQGVIKESDAYRIQLLKRTNIGPTFDGSVSASESLPLIAACTASEVKVLKFNRSFMNHYQYPFKNGIATCFTKNYIVAASENKLLIIDTEIRMRDFRYVVDFEFQITRLISNDAFYPFCVIVFEDGDDNFMKIGTINVETLERRMLVKGGAFASVANKSTMSDEALQYIGGGNTLIPFDDFAVSYAGTPIGLTNSFVIAYKATGPEVLGYMEGADTLITTFDAVFVANTSNDKIIKLMAITADGPTQIFEFPQTLSYLCCGVGCSKGVFVNDDGTPRTFIVNDENRIIELKSEKSAGIVQDASRIATIRSDTSVFLVAQLENGFIATYSTPLEPESEEYEYEEEEESRPRGLEVIRNFRISIASLGETETVEEEPAFNFREFAKSLERHPWDNKENEKPVFKKYDHLIKPCSKADPFLSKRLERDVRTMKSNEEKYDDFAGEESALKAKHVSKSEIIKMRRYFGK